jgi:hypothetical protein
MVELSGIGGTSVTGNGRESSLAPHSPRSSVTPNYSHDGISRGMRSTNSKYVSRISAAGHMSRASNYIIEDDTEEDLPDHLTPTDNQFLLYGFILLVLLGICLGVHFAFPDDTAFFKPPTDSKFWIALLGSPLLIFGAMFIWAIPAVYKKVPINYTRKGLHFTAQLAIFISLATGLDDEGGIKTDTLENVIAQLILIAPYQVCTLTLTCHWH